MAVRRLGELAYQIPSSSDVYTHHHICPNKQKLL